MGPARQVCSFLEQFDILNAAFILCVTPVT